MHPSPIFDFSSPGPGAPLVLVPTGFERSALRAAGCDWPLELCGFGVIAAAARTATLLENLRPSRVLLLGIAGTYAPEVLPIASAARFGGIGLWGLGAGNGAQHLGPADMFPQWTCDDGNPIEQDLATTAGKGRLVTVCAASDSPSAADPILVRYEDALAEDMEGFAVALACRLKDVPFDCIRGISNVVGDRDKNNWALRPALDAAWHLAQSEFTS
ncbi:MAG: hypothetical protein P1V35_03050 [Planctomycetota bacterium]|nr:hypothetical protein [Planctomycetota bacterium]